MTSYTRKLYKISPSAAEEVRRQNYRDYRYGKHVTLAQFTPEGHFGKRPPSAVKACKDNCGHPNCRSGCTLQTIDSGSLPVSLRYPLPPR